MDRVVNFSNSFIKLFKNKKTGIHEPHLDRLDIEYTKLCINSTYVSNISNFVKKFSNSLKKFTKSKNVIPLSSGTAALHIALETLGVDHKHEVLIPSFTFIATANAVKYCNANPHFVEIEDVSLGMDFIKLDKYLQSNKFIRKKGILINKKTKKIISTIIPVHALGNSVDIKELIRVSKKYKLDIIEDASGSIGTFYKNQHLGTFGKFGVLSFNGNKTITTGGGGALLCQNKNLAKKALHLANVAKVKSKHIYYHDKVGYNYIMPGINAALGLAQIKKLPDILKIKKNIFQHYVTNLSRYNFLEIIKPRKEIKSNYWINTCILINDNKYLKNKIISNLNKRNFGAKSAWMPLHKLKIYSKSEKMSLKTTNFVFDRIITLPSGTNLILNKNYKI